MVYIAPIQTVILRMVYEIGFTTLHNLEMAMERERERRCITLLCPHAVKYLIYEQENGMSQCDSIHYLMAHATRGIFLIRKEHSP